jgi:Putative peptidoglycan binding domain
MPYDLPPSIDSSGPVGDGEYIVRDGDCIESIAFAAGHVWQTIWNHPNNAALKTARVSRNVLLPGDQLFIPPRDEKAVACAADAKHKFVRKGAISKLRLCLLEGGQPRANQKYRLVIDDEKVITGTTDGEGWIEVAIPPNAAKGELTVGDNPLDAPYRLNLGGMDPITEPRGVQKRLRNLGFACEVTGEMDEPTRAALAMFQKGEDLDATGEPDRDTLDKVKARCGC